MSPKPGLGTVYARAMPATWIDLRVTITWATFHRHEWFRNSRPLHPIHLGDTRVYLYIENPFSSLSLQWGKMAAVG